ncbi:MAG: septum formation family protein [Pseudoclavibacter sp.]
MPRSLPVSVAAVIGAALLMTGCAGADDPSASQTPVTADPEDGAPTNFLDLEIGDCFDIPSNLPDGEALLYSSCDVLHMFEAFAETELPSGDYPGDDAVESEAAEYCQPAFVEFVGESWTTSDFDFQYIVPSELTWGDSDDRTIMCLVTSLDGLPWSGTSAEGGSRG